MAAPVASDRTSVAEPTTVSASALALHLDCSRTYIGKLEAEGVIQRHGDGFPLDHSRVAYLRYLRRARQQSPRSEADAAFTAAKTAPVAIRVAEKRKQLMLASDHVALVEKMTGLFLTGLSGFAAQIARRDIAKRHVVDRVVYDLRVQIAEAAGKMADEAGEPALEDAAT
jgi:hypothetical protein